MRNIDGFWFGFFLKDAIAYRILNFKRFLASFKLRAEREMSYLVAQSPSRSRGGDGRPTKKTTNHTLFLVFENVPKRDWLLGFCSFLRL